MRRREAWQAKEEGRDERTLFESDFLLGVFDGHRMGGVRFKLREDGAFMNDQKNKKVTTKKADPKISSTKSYRKLTKDDTGKTSTAKKKPTKNAITVVKVIANSINLVFG